ncbi:MAG: UDP-2,4-diacetamido-2,4,6-trideoxy-beta-L-altropyranose hydrolase [Alphaproteobacteria bacterium]|nr:UDP-2,4-diacetamido-2,4,6-trideoxy-beta-L-altropyranose hydrolase [Alphaproteobacteria bacterium]
MKSTRPKLALFRADASAAIGSGHVRRCLSVAAALKRDGWVCRFAVTEESLTVVPELIAGEFETRALEPAALRDVGNLARSAPEGCDLVVVDHYGLDRTYESSLPGFARRVLVIDDLADRDHDCDVLVDATAGRHVDDYAVRAAGADLLLGPSYAPLQPAFAVLRARRVTHPRDHRRMLINFGGTDPDDATGGVLTALSAMRLPDDLHIDVVLGHGARHAARVTKQLAAMPDRFRLHLDAPDMALLLAEADIAIGAGGVSALERCCLGVPSILIVIADNQRLVASSLAKEGAARLARDSKDAATQAMALLDNRVARQAMSTTAASLCDGRGAARIAMWVDPEDAKDGRPVRLRPAAATDEAITLVWQQQPETRRFARDARIPMADEHRAWFAAKRAETDCLFNIVLHGGQPAGTVRLDRRDGGWEVSIAIDAARHGAGIGRAALALARRLVPEAPLLAQILPGNEASHALFARAGYVQNGPWYVSRPH